MLDLGRGRLYTELVLTSKQQYNKTTLQDKGAHGLERDHFH